MVNLPRSRGFTFTELMAALAVLAILSAMAAPSFSAMIGSMRARNASSDLYASLSLARSEAIKRNAEVTLLPASTWGSGWHTVDPADTSRDLDRHSAIANGTITGPDSVIFLPTGRVKGTTEPAFDISVTGQSQHRCVRVDLTGRPNQSTSGC
jgi:type IV fimbrial biogenesis protein FimT